MFPLSIDKLPSLSHTKGAFMLPSWLFTLLHKSVCIFTHQYHLICILFYNHFIATPWTIAPPGSSVHGIFQARILEWVAISFSRGSSWHRDRTCASCLSCIGQWILYCWATWETPFYNHLHHNTRICSSLQKTAMMKRSGVCLHIDCAGFKIHLQILWYISLYKVGLNPTLFECQGVLNLFLAKRMWQQWWQMTSEAGS